MAPADPSLFMWHDRLKASGKVSLSVMLATGVLVCFAAHAQGRVWQSVPSKIAASELEASIAQKATEGEEPEELVKSPELAKNKAALSVPRRQNPQFHSRLLSGLQRELIPGLNAAKIPPAPAGADPESPPVYISGEDLEGYADSTVRVQGRGQLIREMMVVQGEELTYNRQSEVATASENVRINYEGNIFKGEWAELHVPTSQGYFDQATYELSQTGAHGDSQRINFTGKNEFSFDGATYTLCQPKADGKYDWVLSAESIDLDIDADKGVARNAVLRFMDVPILATPWMSFPLSNKRRSGLLMPYFDISNDSGFTYSQPIYWNIAPNYDATITPMIMTKRGVGLGAEFRYLQPDFSGVFTGLYLPNDRLRRDNRAWLYEEKEGEIGGQLVPNRYRVNGDRWGYSLTHNQLLARDLDFVGNAQLKLDLNRASDHNYWQDFPKTSGSLTSRLLNNEGSFTTQNSNGFSSLIRVQRWQTLQNPEAYIIPPFDRTQFRLNFSREDQYGFDLSAMADITKFESDDIIRNNVNATRGVMQVAASYPFRDSGMFFIPKVLLTTRYYDFTDGITYPKGFRNPNGNPNLKMGHLSVTMPTVSLDAGLVFERKASLFSKEYVQTLEPRAMYTYTPYRDQSLLPLYDSGEYDYNLATIYLDNPYSGYDRIADVNMMTVGVGTRWLNPQTGQQALSLNVAQRLRFTDQRVTLDGEPITSRYSDVLFNISTELVQDWRFDALVQYDMDENRSQRSLLMARWKPGKYRVMNFGYRMLRESSEQVDLSWQWPLGSPWMGSKLPEFSKNGGRWFTVGRMNYSLRDSKLVDGVFGVEYQSCCWISRVVLERISTGRTKATTRLLFQLELSGLSRIGMNPLQRLQDNIYHYETIRNERIVRPNDFYLYE